jgi:hypothetical protein
MQGEEILIPYSYSLVSEKVTINRILVQKASVYYNIVPNDLKVKILVNMNIF